MSASRAPQSCRLRPLPVLLLPAVIILGLVLLACESGDEDASAPADGPEARETRQTAAPARAPVLPGIDVLLRDSLHLVRGSRAGLITNHTGIDSQGRPSIDRLVEAPDVELVALFSPEHGIRGTEEGGVEIVGGRDPVSGLPVHSLYGETRKPTPEMLADLDILLFDIQDVGARYYTYVSTMALAMEAAGEAGIPFLVLDRPNPIDGVRVQGNVLDPAFSTFVGLYPVPMRHGMTAGELARLYRGEFGVRVDLRVVPAAGWRRSMRFSATGLPWVPPSPNMPSVTSALHYPGTCLFEGTNLSVGRGTDEPFQVVGAPWLRADALVTALEGYGLPGVRFEAARFAPRDPGDGKFGDQEAEGVRLLATSPGYDPTLAALALLRETRKASGSRWEWRVAHFDRLAGTDALRMGLEEGATLEELRRGWEEDLARFRQQRQAYLLYPE